MLRWAATFLVIAIIAALLGFTGIAGAAADIAKFLFFLFIAIFVAAAVGTAAFSVARSATAILGVNVGAGIRENSSSQARSKTIPNFGTKILYMYV